MFADEYAVASVVILRQRCPYSSAPRRGLTSPEVLQVDRRCCFILTGCFAIAAPVKNNYPPLSQFSSALICDKSQYLAKLVKLVNR